MLNEINEPAAADKVVDIKTARECRARGQTMAEHGAAEQEAHRLDYENWLGMDPAQFAIVEQAAKLIAEHRDFRSAIALKSPKEVSGYIKARIGARPNEVFLCLFLNKQLKMLGAEELFQGTIDGTEVPARVVVREALRYNASTVIFAHNHPAGCPSPSAADRSVTAQLRDALKLVGVNVLDHFIVGDGEPTSMASQGLI